MAATELQALRGPLQRIDWLVIDSIFPFDMVALLQYRITFLQNKEVKNTEKSVVIKRKHAII